LADKLRVGVLISGRGSNLLALLEAARSPEYPAEICLVISNRPDAGGLSYAASHGVATATIDHRTFDDRATFDAALSAKLQEHGVELVCLAGFMRLLGAEFVATWHNRLVNVHPALLPSFKGIDAVEQALAAGVKVTGCTLHFVRAEMDTGPIIAQTAVPVRPGDTAEGLGSRIREAEHQCYPSAVRLIAEGRVSVANERVEISGD